MSAPPSVEASGISKSFGVVRALDGVSLNVRPGTAMSITAANRDKLTVDVDGQSVQIERPVAAKVWVRPITASTSR